MPRSKKPVPKNFSNDEIREALIYRRRAYKHKDSYDGLLYERQWDMGYQHLIFDSEDHAERWFNAMVKWMLEMKNPPLNPRHVQN